jgi:hypothetical protein|tara:strand:- start:88 stop:1296 length:1209 start_codon:yes stop_codon:yes gene_type:complete
VFYLNDKIYIDYVRHPGQIIVNESTARFKGIACGRRWGKTKDSFWWLVEKTTKKTGSIGWWVAPTYKQLAAVSLIVKNELPFKLVKKKLMNQETIRYIEFINGSMIFFHSADNPEDMRGSGIHYLVIDEAGQIKKDAWQSVLRPALADYKGEARFISTPKGHNWFFEVWTMGQDPENKEYESFVFPTSNNPHIDKLEIEAARKELPETVFNQEFLARFLDNVGSVFKKIDSYVKDDIVAKPPYTKGYDLAKHQDYTVLIALDSEGQLVGFERFNKIDWGFQKKKIIEFNNKFPGPALMDSTGIGDPIYDDLMKIINVEGYKFTNQSKKELVENLIMMLDDNRIKYPSIEVLLNELKMFTYKLGATGNVSYGAPEGKHDDCVVALMLSAWLLGTYRVPKPMIA